MKLEASYSAIFWSPCLKN